MAYEGWFTFNGVEVINAGRTVALARTLGISPVRARGVEWIEQMFDSPGGFGLGLFGEGPFGIGDGDAINYHDIAEAPWYDEHYPASAEFAGVLPLSVRGLEGSTLEASTVEYITDGGHSMNPRNKTLSIVADVMLVAKTERGAHYGARWLSRVLRPKHTGVFNAGSDLTYFPYAGAESTVHRRDVHLTRSLSITMKRVRSCWSLWRGTFTLTADDPYEYGAPVLKFQNLGGTSSASGPGLLSQGSIGSLSEEAPVTYDYSPIYDPLYPALVPAPTAPDLLPEGWNIEPGMTFSRRWARIDTVEPATLNVVPVFSLTSSSAARRVRVSIFPGDTTDDAQQGALFSAVINYLPASTTFYVDGEQQAAYTWDGASPFVRRGDSLVFSPTAGPVQWASFNDHGLLVALDLFSLGGGLIEGAGNVRAALSLIPKSD